jgi:hypothetical protein
MRKPGHRNYRPDGTVITPMTAFEAEEMGAKGVKLRCMSCGHTGERSFVTIAPEAFVPDVGLSMKCSKCGAQPESWLWWPTKHGSAKP